MQDEFVFFPLKLLVKWNGAVDFHWLRPYTLYVIFVGVFKEISKTLSAPKLSTEQSLQQGYPAYVVVMYMGRYHHIYLLDAENISERFNSVQEGSAGRKMVFIWTEGWDSVTVVSGHRFARFRAEKKRLSTGGTIKIKVLSDLH